MEDQLSNPNAQLDGRALHEKHPELFHYTSVAGLEGILTSQCLWATHWQYLNDSAELQHFATEQLPKLIKPGRLALLNEHCRQDRHIARQVAQHGGADLLCEEEARGLASAMRESLVHVNPSEQTFEFYITSFATPDGAYEGVRAHGLLSQWRYYGKDGGFAIVLDTAELEKLMDLEQQERKSRISLGEVAYASDSPDVIESRIGALRSLQDAVDRCGFKSPEECLPLLEPSLQCFIHYKHWCFAEEREVRLVAVLNGQKARDAHIADGTEWPERERHYSNGVPRIHLFENLKLPERPYPLPIKWILVGPGPGQNAREMKLRALLERLGYDIPVALSDFPVRF